MQAPSIPPLNCRSNAKTCLGLVLAFALVITGNASAQTGYTFQGPNYAAPAARSRVPTAYAQQGAPPAGSGLGSQPYYGPPSPPPAPLSHRSSPVAYQQQPVRQQYTSPPAYGQQPYPYPAGTVQQPNYKPTSTKKKTAPTYDPYTDYVPPTPSPSHNSTAQLRDDVSDLKLNDRKQDRRLAALETQLGNKGRGLSDSDPYTTYTVRQTDTLWRIADKYNTTPTQIKAANHMASDAVRPGQTLLIPTPRKTSNLINNGSSKSATHLVQRGETLSGIAASYNLSLAALQNANGIHNANNIQLNQRLTIPGRSVSKSPNFATKPPAKKSSKSTGTPRYVTTPKADTQTVAYAPVAGAGTDFTGSIAPPQGQRGIISYRVEHGDTIDSVARSFSTSASEIQSINKLPSRNLPADGSEIIVPSTGPVSL